MNNPSVRWDDTNKRLVITTATEQVTMDAQGVYDLLEHLYQYRVQIMDAAHAMPRWARPDGNGSDFDEMKPRQLE